MAKLLTIQEVQAFRKLKTRSHIQEKLILYSKCTLQQVAVIKAWHDILLFICAYPPNKKSLDLAIAGLKRIREEVNRISAGKDQSKLASLSGTGIANSEFMCAYSLGFTGFLIRKFYKDIALADEAADKNSSRNLLQALLPQVEFRETTTGTLSLSKRTRNLSGEKNKNLQLQWIWQQLDQTKLPLLIKDHLYENLQIFISWKLRDELFNRTFLRAPVQQIFFRSGFLKKVNSRKLIDEKIASPLKLSVKEKQHLIDIARASLAFYCRETDPFTYADPHETELFDMDRGLQIVLIGMNKGRRLSLESYIGFMAFKNGVPVSYGGGWMFGHRCKIGVNIYPPFRGGESAWLFSQVLRLYRQYYHVKTFVVNPYQFGKDNTEGLKSGAFWFYYRLGFRPADETVGKLAADEWMKIRSHNKYRTSLTILKQFTSSDMLLHISEHALQEPDPDMVSKHISTSIIENFKGDRKKAIEVSLRIVMKNLGIRSIKNQDENQRRVLQNISLLLYFLSATHEWSVKQKKAMVDYIKIRDNNKELRVIKRSQKLIFFWKSLYKRMQAGQ